LATKQLSDGGTDGVKVGQSTTDKVGFWGVTPVVQPAATAQSAVSTDVFSLTGTYNSTIIITSLTALHGLVTAMRTALVDSGIMKGSA
jgi:Na+/alanine symporter